jgi:hypothetical protein
MRQSPRFVQSVVEGLTLNPGLVVTKANQEGVEIAFPFWYVADTVGVKVHVEGTVHPTL